MHFLLRLNDVIDAAVRGQIVTQPLAKAFALSSYADAESGGEGQVFERALLRASDPAVAKMIRIHQEDEIRHARLLDERREALGLPKREVPASLKLIDLLSVAAGGVLELPMDKDEDIAAAYTLLYVIEERALDEFARASRAFDLGGDTETATLFRSIAADERRHLRYCEAIGRRYAGDAGFEGALAKMRVVERKVYGRQTRDWLWYLVAQRWISLPWSWGFGVRALMSLSGRLALPAPAPVV